ncbi:MAG: hypothetical protein WCP16_22915 [Pseudanabaena sp. ELA645]|jgi:mRNA interferase RelE/StbE
MIYVVQYSPSSFVDLEKLTQTAQDRIIKKIDWLTDNFDKITPQALTANLSGFYKFKGR